MTGSCRELYSNDPAQVKAIEAIRLEEYAADAAMIKAQIAFDESSAKECGFPPDAVAALTIWGESRGEGVEGMEAVASVIHRRAMRRASATNEDFGLAVSGVCLAKHQFSCWNVDGTFNQSEPRDCKEWEDCDRIAKSLVSGEFAPTIVATNYHADHMNPAPNWAAKIPFVGKIGHHLFYKDW